MLKALELVGFKSFADRTRFEFPPGITCIVGPNGSGKSNVVDAVKWVLGEQSVKSLRGKEMADVIFNGAVGRAPMNAAEATLTFDNSSKKLPVDTPDVLITRRVYRNGESEYLINKQPVRLRDIRDLFSGTGAATEAYSVIEQGKVDVLLQSSPKERRSIFEEAAGISRFKARKLDSLRRLERVEQNLLRLHDIVEEVEGRLKSVRNQASKARRYQEHVERLQQLRTHAALADWRAFTARIEAEERAANERRTQRDALSQQVDAAEARLLQIDAELGDKSRAVHAVETATADVRRTLATQESIFRNEMQRIGEFEEEASRHRRRLAALGGKATDERQLVEETDAAVRAAAARHAELVASCASAERRRSEIEAERRAAETAATEHETLVRSLADTLAAASTELSVVESRLSILADEQTRRDRRRTELTEQAAGLEREAAEAAERLAAAEIDLAEATEARSTAAAALAHIENERTAAEERVQQLRENRAAAAERAVVLEDLLRRHEGLTAGVKEVLGFRETDPTGVFKDVVGLVADVIRSPLETAAAVDASLGERAQYVVIGNGGDLQGPAQFAATNVAGRVGFIAPTPSDHEPTANGSPAGRPGVIGRLDLLVDFEEPYRPLVRRLLSGAWLVETLELATALRKEFSSLSFVTRRGECLTTDGAILSGRRTAGLGLIERRSELLELRDRLTDLDRESASAKSVLVTLESQRRTLREQLQSRETAQGKRRDAVAELRSTARAAAQRRDAATRERTQFEQDAETATGEQATTQARRESIVARLAQVRDEIVVAERAGQGGRERLARILDDGRTIEGQWQVAQVEAAKSEERLHHLQLERLRQEQDRVERQKSVDESRAALEACFDRIRQATLAALAAEGEVAVAALAKQRYGDDLARLRAEHAALQAERIELANRMQTERSRLRTLHDELHALEMTVQATRLERSNLADRIRDDYQLELSAIEAEPATAEALQQREEVDRQIADLRRKINHIGNVNLEALHELEELETRFAVLSAQFNDMSNAKKTIETIIARIDADSRRLFTDTLETVKGHFQLLFRKLFGGGHADVILEENVDILEAGIEIIARPPGKEPRNISLLSGGEKTMTCVALLLAVFQYRPSPFCVLDEVDAALDEANIGRFVGVLTEFLSWTQFIIVTHSKRTMTCGTTLYGVTMQESGISKRVAVRFEDVTDDGHIVTRKDVDAAGDKADTDAA
jgi:chromosome segregation protein